MTDQTTNVEIEDVLSSIRRLVSEDLRLTQPGDDIRSGGRATLSASWEIGAEEPLLLVASDSADVVASGGGDSDPAGGAPVQPAPTFILTADFMVEAPAAEAAEADAEGEGDDDAAAASDAGGDAPAPQAAAEAIALEPLSGTDLLSSYGSVGPAADPADPWDAGDPVARGRTAAEADTPAFSLEETIADLELAVASHSDEFEPDGGDGATDPFLGAAAAAPGTGLAGNTGADAAPEPAEAADATPQTATEAGPEAGPEAAPEAARRRGEAELALAALRRQSRLHLLDSTDPAVPAFVPGGDDGLGHLGISDPFSLEDTGARAEEAGFVHVADPWRGPGAVTGDDAAEGADAGPDLAATAEAGPETAAEPLAEAAAGPAEAPFADAADETSVGAPEAAAEAAPAGDDATDPAAGGDDAGAPHLPAEAAPAEAPARRPVILRAEAETAALPDHDTAPEAPAPLPGIEARLTEVAGAAAIGGLVQSAIDHLSGKAVATPTVAGDDAAPVTAGAGTIHHGEALIDVDLLRQMVAEMIRQELQGALGERITRNVRKLVRREINRALESQNLDD